VTLPISAGTLAYYPPGSLLANQHVFNVGASGAAVFQCGDPRKPETKSFSLGFPLSSCVDTPFLASGRDILAGILDCKDGTNEEGTWSFARQAK
jgi:hypothetical protein